MDAKSWAIFILAILLLKAYWIIYMLCQKQRDETPPKIEDKFTPWDMYD